MFAHNPAAGTTGERLFYVALFVASGSGWLVTMPWLLRGFIQTQVLAYLTGYMHQREDEPERPALSVVR